MKKIAALLLAVTLSVTTAYPAFASDWDKAGKALAVIEGLRIFTGGNVDVFGNITGINKNKDYGYSHHHKRKHRRYARRSYCSEKVWVEKPTWERKYIPEHETFHEEYGNIVVEGHYIKIKKEGGGYWKTIEFNC